MNAQFVKSSQTIRECPQTSKPEFAFIGRSNVGKSSLINMLTGNSRLAKTSGTPGKTQTINHFLIDDSYYIVDLPGYGYAKAPQTQREKWINATNEYLLKRENLMCVFVLLDSRIKPQQSDLDFMEFLGLNGIPMARVFTKTDKIGKNVLAEAVKRYDDIMLVSWESLPDTFLTSSVSGMGKEELIEFLWKISLSTR